MAFDPDEFITKYSKSPEKFDPDEFIEKHKPAVETLTKLAFPPEGTVMPVSPFTPEATQVRKLVQERARKPMPVGIPRAAPPRVIPAPPKPVTQFPGAIERDTGAGMTWNEVDRQNDKQYGILSGIKNMYRSVDEAIMGIPIIRSFSSGLSNVYAGIARIPADIYDLFAFPQNVAATLTGWDAIRAQSPEWLQNNPVAKHYDKAAESLNYSYQRWGKNGIGFEQLVKQRNPVEIAEYFAHQVIANAPNQIAILASAYAGFPGLALTFAGQQEFSRSKAQYRKEGYDPALSTALAASKGVIEAGFENIGTMGILRKWPKQLAKVYGKEGTLKIITATGKMIGHSMLAEGNEEVWTSIGQDFVDYASGLKPEAMKGAHWRAAEAGITGALTGGIMTAPTATFMGARGVVKSELNKIEEESKEANKDIIEKLESKMLKLEEKRRAPARVPVEAPAPGFPLVEEEGAYGRMITEQQRAMDIEDRMPVKKPITPFRERVTLEEPDTYVKAQKTAKKAEKKARGLKYRLIYMMAKWMEPAALTRMVLGRAVTSRVLRVPGEVERDMLKMGQEKILSEGDMEFNELERYFDQFTEEEQRAVFLAMGVPESPGGEFYQNEALKKLPKDAKYTALKEISDWIFKTHKDLFPDEDLAYRKDYFYGAYKNSKNVDAFFKWWRSTDRYKKRKVFPTASDAMAWGLELRDANPVRNLKRRYLHAAHLASMMRLRNDLVDLGLAAKIEDIKDFGDILDPTKTAPVHDPVFTGYHVNKDAADLINNIISTNLISQSKAGRTLRVVNRLAQWIKFTGSIFHAVVIAKQAAVDTGLAFGDILKHPGLVGARYTKGFSPRSKAAMEREAMYQDIYIPEGGGHQYSLESRSEQAIQDFFRDRNLGKLFQIFQKGIGIPTAPLRGLTHWMFDFWIPQVKYQAFKMEHTKMREKLGRDLTSDEVQEIIKEGQNFYGEMNERLFGRTGTMTSLLRFVFIAPSFGEGNFRTMGKAMLQFREGRGWRSRRNIVQSLVASVMFATIASRLFTGKWKEPPEDIDDMRDFFKIDTGMMNARGEKIMIDMLNYDKDYWNQLVRPSLELATGVAELDPEKAAVAVSNFIGNAWRRMGHMKTSTLGVAADLYHVMANEAIYDWKGNQVWYPPDPLFKKMMKIAEHELKRFEPIPLSVFQRGMRMGLDMKYALITAFAGIRPVRTERDRNINQLARIANSLAKQQEDMYYKLGIMDTPLEAIKKYNAMVNDFKASKYCTPEIRLKLEKRLIDPDRLLKNKLYHVMTRKKIDKEKFGQMVRYIQNFDLTLTQARRLLRQYCMAPFKRRKNRYRSKTWKEHDKRLVERWKWYQKNVPRTLEPFGR